MACILLCSSAVRVHDSQAYRKMDVTKDRAYVKAGKYLTPHKHWKDKVPLLLKLL